MATIGSADDIQRVIPRGTQPIATVRNAGAVGAAVADLGTGIGAAARVAEDYRIKKDRTEVVTANSKFGVDRYKLLKEFEDRDGADGSYNDWGEEYQTKVDKLLHERSSNISNPRLKTEFEESQQLKIVEGAGRLHDYVKTVEKDFKLEELNIQLDEWREAAIDEQGEEAIIAIEEMVELYEQNGWLPENNQVAETFRQSAVKGWIKSLPAPEQVAALESDLAKDNMPTDERKAALKVARVGELAYVAEGFVMDYLNDDLSREEMIAKTNDLTVVGFNKQRLTALKNEIRRSYSNQLSDRAAADLEQQSELFSEHFLPVREGSKSIKDIPREDLEAMSPSQQSNLFTAEGQTNGRTPTISDGMAIDRLHFLNESRQWSLLRQYFIEGFDAETAKKLFGVDEALPAASGLLTPTDVDTWSQRSHDGTIPDAYEPLFPILTEVTKKVGAIYKGDSFHTANSKVGAAMTDWYHRVHNETGKSPTDKMVQDHIDRLLLEGVTDYGFLWDSTKRLFEMTPDELQDVITEAREERFAAYDKVVAAGIDPVTRPLDFIEAVQRVAN